MVWPWLPTAATDRLPYRDSIFVKLPTHQDFFVSPRSVLVAFPWSFMDMWQLSYCTQVPSRYISCHVSFFVILCVLSILPFKMAPKCNAEVLPGVSKHQKAGMCLRGKILGWGKLRSAIVVMLATNSMLTNQQYAQ